jgi:hypothetical protein
MRLHTDGSSIILLSPKGRLTWRESGKMVSEPIPPKLEISEDERNGLLCVTPSGERDFSARLNAAGALAGDAIDEDTVAAVILGQDSTYLVRGPVNLDGDWPSVIDVGKLEPERVKWPVGLIWKKGDKSLYDMTEKFGTGIADVFIPSVECNRFGTAVASCGTGTVAVVRPDSRLPDFCLQLPTQDDVQLHALATEAGVMITLIVDQQDTAYVHIDESGKVLGHRAAQSGIPALALDKGFLIYDDDTSSLELVDNNLKTITKLKAPWQPFESASAADGSSFALADADNVLRGHINAKGKLVIVQNYEYGDHAGDKLPGEIAAIEAKWDPERCHGKSAVGFAAGMKQDPWSATCGEDFELVVHARSTGGPGEGISITLAGDATKHCTFAAIVVGEVRIEVQKDDKGAYTAEFPNVILVQGLAYPYNPKPKNDAQKHAAAMLLADTHVELRFIGSAQTASSDLLSVSISALRSDSPPLKWMRPLTIA